MDDLRGYYLEDLKQGMSAVYTKTVTDADLVLFAGVSGDINPMHVDQEYAKTTMFQGRIAHGMLTASFISAVLVTKLPGPGCIYLSQNLKFKAPVRPGDTVRAKVTVKSVDLERRRAELGVEVELREMDVTSLDLPDASFDAAVASFLFCVLPEEAQVPALNELGRVVKPGGAIRLLEYVRPQGAVRRVIARMWEPWMAWAYGAGFDRHTEAHVPEAGLEVADSRYVVDDLIKLITARRPG